MLPLAGSDFPQTHAALEGAIQQGLKQHGVAATGVRLQGGEYPHIEELTIDLTGSRLDREMRLPLADRPETGAVTAGHFHIEGKPLLLEATPVQLLVRGDEARFDYSRTAAGEPALSLAAAKNGEIEIDVQRRDLEELIRSIATEAASKQGVEIKSATLELNSRGPRSIAFRAEVKAKMMIMSAKVTVSGEAAIDEQLQARVSNLTCSGDGMVGSIASGFIRPYFQKIEQRPIPLLAFSLGEVKLRDITVQGGEALSLRAKFSS